MQYFGNYVISWERSWFATHFVHMYTIFRLLYRYVLYNVIIVYKTCIQQSVRIILYAFQATIHLKILRILGSLLVIGTPRWRRIYGDKWVRWPSTSGSGVISIIIIVDEPFFFFCIPRTHFLYTNSILYRCSSYSTGPFVHRRGFLFCDA